MPEPPKHKVGLVSCSGEELPGGTISRLATLKVLESLHPNRTVTICLPLFLAGGEGDRAFARFYPTITIDGCEKRCAARATEMYSSTPAVSLITTDFTANADCGSARRLTEAGNRAVDNVAREIARQVDILLGVKWERKHSEAGNEVFSQRAARETVPATCSCGSGIPVTHLTIGGRPIEVVALPLILAHFREAGKPPTDATAAELLDTVRIYNPINDCELALWKQPLLLAYAAFCEKN